MLSLADSLQPCFLPGSVLTRAALLSLANLQASAAPLSSERGIGGDETCRAVTGQPPRSHIPCRVQVRGDDESCLCLAVAGWLNHCRHASRCGGWSDESLLAVAGRPTATLLAGIGFDKS